MIQCLTSHMNNIEALETLSTQICTNSEDCITYWRPRFMSMIDKLWVHVFMHKKGAETELYN